MTQISLIKFLLIIFILLILTIPAVINAEGDNTNSIKLKSTLIHNGKLTVCKLNPHHYEVVKKVKMMVTAYSSTPDQTDDTPFITASGSQVRDGIVAINGLKFGTKVRIPALFGEKIFVVEDRMHSRKGIYHADIWFQTREEAKQFGAKISEIEILES